MRLDGVGPGKYSRISQQYHGFQCQRNTKKNSMNPQTLPTYSYYCFVLFPLMHIWKLALFFSATPPPILLSSPRLIFISQPVLDPTHRRRQESSACGSGTPPPSPCARGTGKKPTQHLVVSGPGFGGFQVVSEVVSLFTWFWRFSGSRWWREATLQVVHAPPSTAVCVPSFPLVGS